MGCLQSAVSWRALPKRDADWGGGRRFLWPAGCDLGCYCQPARWLWKIRGEELTLLRMCC